MRRFATGLLLGLVLGVAAGLAGGLYALPLLDRSPGGHQDIPTPRGTLVGQGRFGQADPQDHDHWGSGGFLLYENQLRLGPDFAVSPGPKYHLYLVPEAELSPDSPVYRMMFIDLGPLKEFAGAQTYPVPAGLDLREYPSLAVWSEQLQELISPAPVRLED